MCNLLLEFHKPFRPAERDAVHIATKLHKDRDNVRHEVCVSLSRSNKIDFLTDTHIVEFKTIKHWVSAIGQILVYNRYKPRPVKTIVLFGSEMSPSVMKHAHINLDELGIDCVFMGSVKGEPPRLFNSFGNRSFIHCLNKPQWGHSRLDCSYLLKKSINHLT